MRAAILLFVLFAFPAFAAEPQPPKDLDASVFRVYAVSPDGSVTIGSAVMVADQTLVTNCHITRQAKAVAVSRAGMNWSAETQVRDVHHDLCVLEVPGASGKAPELRASGSLVPGEKVYAVGFAEGKQSARPGEGEVKGLYSYDGGKVIQSSAAFSLGASGGGLFDSAGRLVGIVTFRSSDEDPAYYALPLDWLEASGEGAAGRPGEEPAVAFWQLSPDEQPYFLRAAALEHRGDWSGLLGLSEQWARAETENADAWLAYGKSCAGLRRGKEAIAALHRAVTLDPSHVEAWHWLIRVYQRMSKEIEV